MEIAIAIAANLLVGRLLLAIFLWRRPDVARLETTDQALEIIRLSVPDADGTVVLSLDGQAALLLGADKIYLVQCHGRRFNVRALCAGEVGQVVEVEDSIRIRLRDFGWPAYRLIIADSRTRQDCLVRLAVLRSDSPVSPSVGSSHA